MGRDVFGPLGRESGIVFPLIALLAFLFTGCEEAEVRDRGSKSERAEGILQARQGDDGTTEVELVLAPKAPGERAPSLARLRGQNLSEAFASSSGVRGQQLIPDFYHPTVDNGLFRFPVTWINRNQSAGTSDDGAQVVKLVEEPYPGYEVEPYAWSSDAYVSYFVHGVPYDEVTTITYSNGILTASAQVERRNDGVYARFNDGGEVFVPVAGSGDYSINAYLPIQPVMGSLDLETTGRYLGNWNVTVNPPVVASGENRSPPLDFELRGMVIENVSYTPNPPDEEGNVLGGTFTGEVNLLKSGASSPREEGDLAWTVQIVDRKSGELVYRGHGVEAGFSGSATINGSWDGVPNIVAIPPDAEFVANLWAVVVDSPANSADPAANSGFIATPSFFGQYDMTEPEIEIEPNPFIPFDEESIIEYDEDGNPQWPDYDDDGYPDEYPDFDNDGEPDWEPGEGEQNIHIFSYLGRGGYEVGAWTLSVATDEGEILFQEDGAGPEVNVEWFDPPLDLDPQTFDVTINFERCPTESIRLGYHPQTQWQGRGQIRAQDSSSPLECEARVAEGELAYGEPPPSLEIFPEAVAPPIADSEDDSSAPSDAARKRLGTVHKLENWQLQADLSGVPESERPTELFVQMESQISGVKPPLATLTGGKTTGIYTGQLTATHTDGLIKRERPATGASSAYCRR